MKSGADGAATFAAALEAAEAAAVLRIAGFRAAVGLRVAVGLVAEVLAEVVISLSCHRSGESQVNLAVLRDELCFGKSKTLPASEERFRKSITCLGGKPARSDRYRRAALSHKARKQCKKLCG